MMKLAIINGPNLNLLGSRQPQYYGHMSFENYLDSLKKKYKKLELNYFQSNREGDLIDFIHKADDNYDGIILNAGAYTHTSIAIADAIQAVNVPVVEVHISNIYAREQFRHTSYIAPYCRGVLTGFGLMSYDLAIESFIREA
ncbi:MAG: type II 3-dehydroquinate dehydratase [Sphingobacteriales bacterium]|nr:MAG: type II 3-dehydroquinate dehydratase [Sphingobacteriales bacterium]